MKILPAIFLFVFSAALCSAQLKTIPEKAIPEDYGYIVKIGQQAPGFEMKLPGGKKVSSADFKGKVVMLQFTASWCGVCRNEMPHIESEIWQQYKNNPDFLLYGIDLDEPAGKVVDFGKQVGVTYPIGLDPKGAIFYRFAQQKAGVTRNVIIGRDGKIVYMTRLYKPEEFNEMKEVVGLLLSK